MTARGELVEDPAVLACTSKPCPVATVGQVIEVSLDRRRTEALGFEATIAPVDAITPALHGLLIRGPLGQVIVGGHRSTDQVRVL